MDTTTITLSVLGTIAGALGSTWWLDRRKQQKEKKIREIATKALRIFSKYANDINTYENAKDDFNISLNITEKRTILVCLHKIGVPVKFSSNKVFEIKDVEFEQNKINKDEIKSMIQQVDKGNCDHLFFLDVDTYFTENSRIKFLRNLGVRFVNEVFSKSILSNTNTTINWSENWENTFSKGEQNSICAFKDAIANTYYFDTSTQNASDARLKKLVDEIKIGLWDDFLLTNIESYTNHLYNRLLMQKLTDNQAKTNSVSTAS